MSDNKIIIKSGELRKLEVLERLVNMTDKTENSHKLGTISSLSHAIGFINTDDGCGLKIYGSNNSIRECQFDGINSGVEINGSSSNMVCDSIFKGQSTEHALEVHGNVGIQGDIKINFNGNGVKFGAVKDEEMRVDTNIYDESSKNLNNATMSNNTAYCNTEEREEEWEIEEKEWRKMEEENEREWREATSCNCGKCNCKSPIGDSITDDTQSFKDLSDGSLSIRDIYCPNCHQILIKPSDICYFDVIAIECSKCGYRHEHKSPSRKNDHNID